MLNKWKDYFKVRVFRDEERKKAEAELSQSESILQAVTFAAEQFLKMPDWRANIDIVLERLGKTITATHAYLFEHHLDSDGAIVSSMRYEWTVPGYSSDLENPAFQNSSILGEGKESTDEICEKGISSLVIPPHFLHLKGNSWQRMG